jgi:hypothetical protein
MSSFQVDGESSNLSGCSSTAPLVQLVERLSCKEQNASSNPAGGSTMLTRAELEANAEAEAVEARAAGFDPVIVDVPPYGGVPVCTIRVSWREWQENQWEMNTRVWR